MRRSGGRVLDRSILHGAVLDRLRCGGLGWKGLDREFSMGGSDLKRPGEGILDGGFWVGVPLWNFHGRVGTPMMDPALRSLSASGTFCRFIALSETTKTLKMPLRGAAAELQALYLYLYASMILRHRV